MRRHRKIRPNEEELSEKGQIKKSKKTEGGMKRNLEGRRRRGGLTERQIKENRRKERTRLRKTANVTVNSPTTK